MANNTKQLEVFTIWSDEIENRLDPFFYLKSKYKFDGKFLDEFVDKISSGKNISRDKFIDDGVPYLRVQNLKPYEIEIGELFLPVDAPYPKTTSDTFLTGRVGSLGVFVKANDVYFYSDNILAISFKKSPKIDLDYLEAVLNSPIISEQVTRLSKGNNQKLVSQETIKRIKIPVPPLSVQKEMVEKIQAAYEQKRKKEEEIKKILASIDDFVLGELGIDIAGEHERERERVSEAAPETYAIWSDEIERRIDPNFYRPYYRELLRAIESKNNARLGDIVEFSGEAWDQKSIFADTFPYIEISAIDLKTGDIAEIEQIPVADAPSRAKMIVRQDDIIVSTTRPNRGAITKIEKEQDGSIASTGFAVLRDMKTEKISKDYLFVILRSILSLKQMEQRTTGGNYPAITAEDLKQIRIVLADKATQEKITSGVQSSYSKMRTLRAQAAEVLESAQKQAEQMILA